MHTPLVVRVTILGLLFSTVFACEQPAASRHSSVNEKIQPFNSSFEVDYHEKDISTVTVQTGSVTVRALALEDYLKIKKMLK